MIMCLNGQNGLKWLSCYMFVNNYIIYILEKNSHHHENLKHRFRMKRPRHITSFVCLGSWTIMNLILSTRDNDNV